MLNFIAGFALGSWGDGFPLPLPSEEIHVLDMSLIQGVVISVYLYPSSVAQCFHSYQELIGI